MSMQVIKRPSTMSEDPREWNIDAPFHLGPELDLMLLAHIHDERSLFPAV